MSEPKKLDERLEAIFKLMRDYKIDSLEFEGIKVNKSRHEATKPDPKDKD